MTYSETPHDETHTASSCAQCARDREAGTLSVHYYEACPVSGPPLPVLVRYWRGHRGVDVYERWILARELAPTLERLYRGRWGAAAVTYDRWHGWAILVGEVNAAPGSRRLSWWSE